MEQQCEGYGNKADIWSLGITALELAKGYAPYANFPPMKVLIMTIDMDPPSLNSIQCYPHNKQINKNGDSFSKSFEDFCSLCLQKNPKNRPLITQVSSHPFLVDSNLISGKDSLIQLLNNITDVCIHEEIGVEPFEDDIDSFKPNIENTLSSFSDDINYSDEKGYQNFNNINNIVFNESNIKSIDLLVKGDASANENSNNNNSINNNTNDNNDNNIRIDSNRKVVKIMNDSNPLDIKSSNKDSYVPGTTWIFESNIIPNSSGTNPINKLLHDNSNNNNDGIDEFLEDFDSEEATIKK